MTFIPRRTDTTAQDPVHEIQDTDSTAIMSVYRNSASVTGGTVIAYEDGVESSVRINPYGTGAGTTGELRFQELTANGTNVVGFKAPNSLAADTIYTLPDAYPAADGYTLTGTTAGVMSWTNPSSLVMPAAVAISTDQDDYTFDTSGIIVFNNTGNNSLTGVTAQANGTGLKILNVGSGTLTFKKEDTGSVAANRLAGGANKSILSGQGAQFIYSTDLSRWMAFE